MKGENEDKNEERKMFYDTIEEERNEGLGTGMKPPMTRMTAPIASNKTEAFLYEVRKTLIDHVEAQRNTKPPESQISDDIKDIQRRLGAEKELVAVPTDKTNSIVTVCVPWKTTRNGPKSI